MVLFLPVLGFIGVFSGLKILFMIALILIDAPLFLLKIFGIDGFEHGGWVDIGPDEFGMKFVIGFYLIIFYFIANLISKRGYSEERHKGLMTLLLSIVFISLLILIFLFLADISYVI